MTERNTASDASGDVFTRDLLNAQIPLLKFISSLVPPQDAQDVLQDVNCALLGKRGSYDPERGTVLAWAVQTAKFEILHLSNAKTRSHLSFSSETVELLANSIAAEPEQTGEDRRLEALEQCIAGLPAGQRRLVELHHFQRVPLADLGRRLHRQPRSLAVTLFNIRENLRRCINGKLLKEDNP